MEQKHLTQKMKSSHIITLIFSFLDYYPKVVAQIKSLSKNGCHFVLVNELQLKDFCKPILNGYSPKIDGHLLLSIAPNVKYVEEIRIVGLSELESKFEQLSHFNHVQVFSIETTRDEKDINLNETFLSQLKAMIAKSEEVYISFLHDAEYFYFFDFLFSNIQTLSLNRKKVKVFSLRAQSSYVDQLFQFENLTELEILVRNDKQHLAFQANLSKIRDLRVKYFRLSIISFVDDIVEVQIRKEYSAEFYDNLSKLEQNPNLITNFSNIFDSFNSVSLTSDELIVTDSQFDMDQLVPQWSELKLLKIDVDKFTFQRSNEFTFNKLSLLHLIVNRDITKTTQNSVTDLLQSAPVLENFVIDSISPKCVEVFEAICGHQNLKKAEIVFMSPKRGSYEKLEKKMIDFSDNNSIDTLIIDVKECNDLTFIFWVPYISDFIMHLHALKDLSLNILLLENSRYWSYNLREICNYIAEAKPTIKFSIKLEGLKDYPESLMFFTKQQSCFKVLKVKSLSLSNQNVITELISKNVTLYSLNISIPQCDRYCFQFTKGLLIAIGKHPKLHSLVIKYQKSAKGLQDQDEEILDILESLFIQNFTKLKFFRLQIKNKIPSIDLRPRLERMMSNISKQLPNLEQFFIEDK